METIYKLIMPIVVFAFSFACGGGSNRQAAPTNLKYPASSISAIVGQIIPTDSPSLSGQVTSFSIAPALPTGINLDGITGVISGSPSVPAAEATYTITAANSGGSTSTMIDLLVAAQLPDLRFQCTGAFSSFSSGGYQMEMGAPPIGGASPVFTYTGTSYWGPLVISAPTGDGWGCAGVVVPVPLVGGVTSIYTTDFLANLDNDLATYAQSGLVVTSLDASVRGFGIVVTGPTGNSNQYGMIVNRLADQSALTSWAFSNGSGGAVITAVSTLGNDYAGDSATGPIVAVAATRSGDGNTYETQVLSGTPADLAVALPNLGNQGYVITAFGSGNLGTQTYLAVLTRKTGDSTPRTIRVDGPGAASSPALPEGYVLIGRMATGSAQGPWWVWQR